MYKLILKFRRALVSVRRLLNYIDYLKASVVSAFSDIGRSRSVDSGIRNVVQITRSSSGINYVSPNFK